MPDPAVEAALIDEIGRFAANPLGFVRFAFPWGEPATILAKEKGPRAWQAEILAEIGERLRAGQATGEAIREAVSSGHGIGKSALVAWLVLWAMSTRENTRGIVTANTDTQLRTKTWPEVRKWHALAINAHWFTCEGSSIHAKGETTEKTWRIDAIPWSESNPEAFAGLHNKGNRILVVFDEASAIHDTIWEVTEGALTDEGTEILWCAFGNPTRNTGRFHESCFGRSRHRWACRAIDSRNVEGTNRAQIDAWVRDYGDDSDFVRVRVRGVPPRAGSMQLIPSDIIARASTIEAVSTLADPLVLGVDVARFGDDQTTIYTRRGRDARTFPPIKLRGADTMAIAGRVASHVGELAERRHQVDMIFVDETGIGAGVVDRLRQLGMRVMGVNFGGKADGLVGAETCANKASEMWCRMREWLRTGGAIPDDRDLRQDLEAREFGYDVHNAIVLERKDDMKKRGLASPDDGDGLALTFAHPVHKPIPGGRSQAVTEFDPFANA